MCDLKDAATNPPNLQAGYVPVTRKEQLWRFQVGRDSGGMNFRDELVCFVAFNGKFVRNDAAINGLVLHADWCRKDAQFELEFLDAKAVAIKCLPNRDYWTRREGNKYVIPEPGCGEPERFILYVDKDEDNLVICSTATHRVVTATGWATFNEGAWSPEMKFRGWKTGSKAAWQPRDSWKLVRSPKDLSNAGSVFIGVKHVTTPMAGTVVQMGPKVCNVIYDSFVPQVASAIEMDWSKMPKEIWSEAKEKKAIHSSDNSSLVFQAVGEFGCFRIYSSRFEVMFDQ